MDDQLTPILNNFLNITDNLLIVVSGEKIIFINDKFRALYGENNLFANEILLSMDKGQNEVICANSKQNIVSWRRYDLNDMTLFLGKDITGENRLKKHLDTLSYIMKKVPGYVFWKNTDCILMGCNENFARQIGLSKPEDVVGMTDYDLPWSSEETKRFIEDDKRIMSSGKAKLEFEEEQTQKDGMVAHLLTSKVPIRDSDNHVSGILGIYIDITRLKNSEKNLALEKQKAETLSKAKSEFIANMSHDIRTPITGMIGMTQDLLNTVKEIKAVLGKNAQLTKKEWFEFTAHIENDSNILLNSTDQLLQLCNEILEVTRLDSGIMEKLPETFDLHQLVQNNIELLTPVACNKKLNLTAEIDKNLPNYLKGLREYVSRTLLNILSNSLKFTKRGHVKLKVLLASKLSKNSVKGDEIKIRFLFEDTGIGIPEDKFDTIFEHFSRLSPSYDGIYKGSGLGLYTVKRYVEAMNGQIELESKVGHGTCFKITIPFIISDQDFKPHKSIKSLKAKMPNSNQSKLDSSVSHVLIVEDNAVAAMGISVALKQLHCSVDVAESGEAAIEMAEKNTYDLILMDVGLPGISGIEATKKIRQLCDIKKSRVAIVAVTGHADSPDMVKECLDAGMQHVLSKPANIAELEEIFKKYVLAVKVPDQENTRKTKSSKNKQLDKSIFDIEAAAEILGDKESAWKIFDLLCQALPGDILQVKAAQKENNVNALREIFHKIKGGLSFVKTPQLLAATIELHDAVKLKSLSEIDGLFKNFYEAAEVLLEAYKASNKANKKDV